MSLILLHRLKFSIKFNVPFIVHLVLFIYLISFKCAVTVTASIITQPQVNLPSTKIVTRDLTVISRNDNNNNNDLNDIFRILRDEEDNIIRNDKIRWRKIDGMHNGRRRMKRDNTADSSQRQSQSQRINDNNNNNSVPIIRIINEFAKKNSTKNQILNLKSNENAVAIRNFSDLMKSNNVNGDSFSDILVLNISKNNLLQLNETFVEKTFKNLLNLDVSHNQLSTFMGNFLKLTTLNLSYNQLNAFHVKHMQNLKYLDLSCNVISEMNQLDFSDLNDLLELDLSGNDLIALNHRLFQNMTNLRTINLATNRLVKILKNYFFNLINIEVLILANNDISDIDNDTFVYLPNLQYLDLSYNKLDVRSIRALQGIPDLIGLSVAYNPELGNGLQGFVASWSLKELDASGTGLCQIPAALAQSVHTLNISDNHFQVSFFHFFFFFFS